MSDLPARPRQVTFGAALIIGGSAVIVASVFERVAGLGSLETQKSVQEFLAGPPGDGLGVSADDVVTALRVMSMVAGACATATAILGVYVLRRSRSARVGLALLAVPLFVSGMAVGGFLSAVVAAATAMLWFQPSRDWFDGVVRSPAVEPAAAAPPAQPDPERRAEPRLEPPELPPSAQPRPMSGFGTTTTGYPVMTETPFAAPAPPPGTRPGRLLAACILTWTFSGLAIFVMGLSALVMLAAPEVLFDELHRQNPDVAAGGLSDSEIRSATFVTAAVVLTWSAAAILFAVQAFRRVSWGRVALLVSAVSGAAVCLVGSVFNILLVVPLVACLVTVTLLMRPEVRAWFS